MVLFGLSFSWAAVIGGSLGAQAAGGAIGGPGAGAAAAAATERGLRFLGRMLIEVADKRLQAHALPGIEAMLPDSPLGSLLGRAASRATSQDKNRGTSYQGFRCAVDLTAPLAPK